MLLITVGSNQQHGIAIDGIALRVGEQRTITVTVESDAKPCVCPSNRRLQHLEVRRAAIQIDVAAIGRVANDFDIEPEVAEQLWCHCRRRTVCTVDHQATPGKRPGVRKNLQEVFDVMLLQMRFERGRRRLSRGRPVSVGNMLFDL